jgi:hypothetical protein
MGVVWNHDRSNAVFLRRPKLRLITLLLHLLITIAWNKALGNCVLINVMKKILIGCTFLLVACQPATSTLVAVAPATATIAAMQTPTVVPVTDTPAPTPTPEFTPTPLPRLFTNEFDSPLEGWAILQTGNDTAPKVNAENSTLTLQMDSPFMWIYAVYSAQEYADVRVDARFANQAASPASIGLLCRYSEADGWLEYNVYSDGTYSVLYGQWLDNGIADYLPVLSSSSSAILPSGSTQEIGLICSGTTLSLLIDQTVIRSVDVSRFELSTGKVGIAVSSFENIPVMTSFDWIKVSEP